jgi:CBS domain-containing protein
MIERLRDLPPGIDGLRASGIVSGDDYEAAVEPLVDEAEREHRRLRLLYVLDPEFRRMSLDGAWADVQLGVRHLSVFERVALVSDVGWMRALVRAAGALMPFSVATFAAADRADAVRWLGGPDPQATLPHRLLSELGVLVVEPSRPLRREDFDALARTLDPWLRAHGNLRGVVVCARGFPGWENFGSFLRHTRFLRIHRQHVSRVALAVDGWAAEVIQRVGSLLGPDVRHFPHAQRDRAIRWAAAGAGDAPLASALHRDQDRGGAPMAQAQKVRDVMSKDVVVLAATASAHDAARAMRDHDIGSVVVERDHHICGIVTDRDLVVRALAENDGPEQQLGRFCSQELVSIGPDQKIGDAVRLMEDRAVRRIPVLDDGGQAVGIVSLGDLAQQRDPQSALGRISAAPPNN